MTVIRAVKLPYHMPLLLVLSVHLVLSLSYASFVPLGEAPDEPAQLNYARFIAETQRLPATLADRQAADYRSNWPPLYHVLVAVPVTLAGDGPPTRLKAVGDTPRRLIPTNGQTIASFIHTTDEAWPWRGLPLAWHLGRYVSVGLTALGVVVTYLITWRLTQHRLLATGAAALHAFLPQVLFIGSVVNDDNLLILLSGLVLLTLVSYTQCPARIGLRQVFFLGTLLGLATVTKYNALPLWGVVAAWGGWLAYKSYGFAWRALSRLLALTVPLLGGAIVTGGWWFIFIWRHFNQVKNLGFIRGTLTALVASTSDASLRNLASGQAITGPNLGWREWFTTLFHSFWGSFGGSGTIDFPSWIYWVLALLCLAALTSYVPGMARTDSPKSQVTIPHSQFPTLLFLLTPIFFLPLLLIRFVLTGGDIVETAQGRHLFPALPAISYGLMWGLAHLPLPRMRPTRYTVPTKFHIPRSFLHLFRPASLLPLFALALSIYGLPLIRRSYPPPIPLSTAVVRPTAENLINVEAADGITLVGYEIASQRDGLLPVTLIWQAGAVPAQDYLVKLTLTNLTGQAIGGWLGHPVGGRYPTRAWDRGDVLHHVIPLPLVPGPALEASLTVQLLDDSHQTVMEPVTLSPKLNLAARQNLPRLPGALRADGLPAGDPFTYRSTLSFVLTNLTGTPNLVASDGSSFSPAQFIANPQAGVAHFIVEANWPSGDYQLKFNTLNSFEKSEIQSDIPKQDSPGLPWVGKIENRPRQFEAPPLATVVRANFAGMITLLGYDLPQRRVEPGHNFPVTLHWQADRTMGQSLTVFNHLLDQTLTQRGGVDRIPLRHYSVLLWVPGEIVTDAYQVPVEASAPHGVYWLDVGLYLTNQPTLSLPLVQNGQPLDRNSVPLGPIKVGGPPLNITLPEVNPDYPIHATFGDQIRLLGFNLVDSEGNPSVMKTNTDEQLAPAAAGQPPMINLKPAEQASSISKLLLFWHAEAQPRTDYTVFIHLLDSQNELVAQFDGPPAAGGYPTSLWDPGEIIADERDLGSLPAGHYRLFVGLYRSDTGERLPLQGAADGALQLLELKIGGASRK